MNGDDERFEQRWEFRRREVDGDTSSDDNGSNSLGNQDHNMNHKLVADLVLLENNEESDDPVSIRHDELGTDSNNVQPRTVKAEEKKIETNKKRATKKKVLQKTLEVCGAVKGNKRKRKLITNEKVGLKDLKIFADSLIHELAATRESMFGHMRDEMRKLLPVRGNVGRPQKKKVCPTKATEMGEAKPKNSSGGSVLRDVEGGNVVADALKLPKATVKHETRTIHELHKGDKLRQSALIHMNLTYGSDQLVSSSNLLQVQNQRNNVSLNDRIPPGVSKTELGSLMASKRFSHRIAEFQQNERVVSFSPNRHTSVGFHAAIPGIGFPIPLIQETNNGSNMSSLTYCENSFMDVNGAGQRTNGGSMARYPAP